MKKAELVFIPTPSMSHLVSTVQLARLLVDRDDRLSITFLMIKTSLNTMIDRSYLDSVSAACSRIRFINLPEAEVDPNLPTMFSYSLIEAQKPHAKEEVSKLVIQSELNPDSPRLAGFVLDMFCSSMIDVANEFGVPSYIFFTSGAAILGVEFYLQALDDEQKVDPAKFKDSDIELVVPCLANPLPAKVLPSTMVTEDWLLLLPLVRRYKGAKGIIVNTFYELESHAINSFSDGNAPTIYPVGPILNLSRHVGSGRNDTYIDIMQWLDHQPSSSVVFLCFGSLGSFGVEQVKEIALGLEQSGYRFLWSLREPPPQGKREAPTDYENIQEVLPEGFLDRTANIGKVIGWAPQLDILAHPSIRGFVSHCGWNSTLESIWFGVPIATWPMYAEQQFNAFQMIVELGLAVEIKMDYRKQFNMDDCEIVSAEDIEKGIECLMELDNKKREKLKEMSEKSRNALMNGGSSYTWLGRLTEDMIENIA